MSTNKLLQVTRQCASTIKFHKQLYHGTSSASSKAMNFLSSKYVKVAVPTLIASAFIGYGISTHSSDNQLKTIACKYMINQSAFGQEEFSIIGKPTLCSSSNDSESEIEDCMYEGCDRKDKHWHCDQCGINRRPGNPTGKNPCFPENNDIFPCVPCLRKRYGDKPKNKNKTVPKKTVIDINIETNDDTPSPSKQPSSPSSSSSSEFNPDTLERRHNSPSHPGNIYEGIRNPSNIISDFNIDTEIDDRSSLSGESSRIPRAPPNSPNPDYSPDNEFWPSININLGQFSFSTNSPTSTQYESFNESDNQSNCNTPPQQQSPRRRKSSSCNQISPNRLPSSSSSSSARRKSSCNNSSPPQGLQIALPNSRNSQQNRNDLSDDLSINIMTDNDDYHGGRKLSISINNPNNSVWEDIPLGETNIGYENVEENNGLSDGCSNDLKPLIKPQKKCKRLRKILDKVKSGTCCKIPKVNSDSEDDDSNKKKKPRKCSYVKNNNDAASILEKKLFIDNNNNDNLEEEKNNLKKLNVSQYNLYNLNDKINNNLESGENVIEKQDVLISPL